MQWPFATQHIFTTWMLLDEIQKLQLHNSSFMNQYTYAIHATML
jgi:hypothetical protein